MKKQLGITSYVGARELGVKLGCLAAVDLAEEVLRKYKGEFVREKYSAAQREGLGLEKPLYPAAALYCSCKSVYTVEPPNSGHTWDPAFCPL